MSWTDRGIKTDPLRYVDGCASAQGKCYNTTASKTSIVIPDLAGYGDDFFNTYYYMQIIKTGHELLTLDNSPAPADFSAGATLTGATSLVTATVVAKLTSTTYVIKDRSGTFTDGEVVSDGTNSRDCGAGYPAVTAQAAPTGEVKQITDYVSATGTFTTSAFSQVVESGDECLILHESVVAIGRDDADNAFASTNVVGNRDGSLLERTEYIISMITGGAADLRVSPSIAGTVEEGGLLQFTIALMDIDSGAIASANINISSITQTMERSRGGAAWSAMTAPVFAKADGQVYCSYEFLAAEWQTGDMYRLTLSGVTVTIGTATAYVPAQVWSNIVVETEDIKTTVEAIQTKLNTGSGQPQVFIKSVTSAANAGDVTIATVTTAPVTIDAISVVANSASQTDLTSAAVYGGASKVITFLDTTDMAKANIDAADECVDWDGAVRLGTGKTIVMTLAGTGSTPVDLIVTVTYHSNSDGGYLA